MPLLPPLGHLNMLVTLWLIGMIDCIPPLAASTEPARIMKASPHGGLLLYPSQILLSLVSQMLGIFTNRALPSILLKGLKKASVIYILKSLGTHDQ